ncbi:protein MARD1-like [Prunus persica]|uniref:protein MARD1-like n=1 Tax=Prunus persica TaxID=3760 RepID=UPI0009AB5EB2|nr:protein MARD1-like [Prunus persica]
MKPPRYPKKVPMEEDDASPPAWSPNMENGQGQSGNFLDRCNYCRKILGEKDNIYMYSSLRAFCSPQCRHRQIVVDTVRGKIVYQSTTETVAWKRKMNNVINQ